MVANSKFWLSQKLAKAKLARSKKWLSQNRDLGLKMEKPKIFSKSETHRGDFFDSGRSAPEIFCQKMIQERHYSSTCLILTNNKTEHDCPEDLPEDINERLFSVLGIDKEKCKEKK